MHGSLNHLSGDYLLKELDNLVVTQLNKYVHVIF
jgi:hypothetical protein